MKHKLLALLSILMIIGVLPGAALAAPMASSGVGDDPTFVQKEDNRPDPLTTQQLELKKRALDAKINGKAKGKVHEVARGQYVELAREGEGALWTVLGEFADLSHNTMPQPDRAVNNTDIWVPDFSRDYYMDLLFNDAPGANSMRNFYIEQSSNRYTVHGDVTDWVGVPGDAWTYDDDISGPAVWQFLIDSVNGWYAAQIAVDKTPAEINAYLSQFDVWDRYDYDSDGNFDEPDGYIDTFQSVHAGVGNEACSGTCDWAIWSHSWYAYYNLIGTAGPAFNMLGGIQVGESDYWVGKYTIQPENGGVGVFAHEYGHDLGLPDLYDYYGENGTGFWTLMSSGSWLDDGKDTIGNKSSHMGAWEKFQLGWLKYEVARAGQFSTHKLGPMEFNTKQAQGLFVILPKKEVVTEIGAPYAGSYFYYSGSGDDLDNSMTKSFDLPAGVALSAKVNYEIELDWDYAYLTVNGVPVATNLSTNTDPNGQNFGEGITGSSGGWVDLTADLSAYAGQTVTLGFRYWTDGAVAELGFMVDEISITGYPTDGAEADAGWTFNGFRTSTGTESALFSHYYVAEFRTYKGYDSTLKVGPYYFGYTDNPLLGDYVDHFAYQDGLLINYWDTSQADNNTALHPGQGLLLPIDAHPQTLYRVDGGRWRNRIQTYDSTFTIAPTDGIPNIHHRSVLSPVPSLPGVRVFDDRKSYYDPTNTLGSVITPTTGTLIRILSISAQNSFMQIEVRPAK
ncbi:MAG TPA: immune inhibitor A domain-containing protein [Pyrinomonadaceae bacterium]|nr:immune inhibitor A domain-containing protein [Pyrinomonadaceae bacterium]